MAAISGIKSSFFVDGNNISGSVATIESIVYSNNLLDFTPIENDYNGKMEGISDINLSFRSYVDKTHMNYPGLIEGGVDGLFAGKINDIGCVINGQLSQRVLSRGDNGSISLSYEVQGNNTEPMSGIYKNASIARRSPMLTNQITLPFTGMKTLYFYMSRNLSSPRVNATVGLTAGAVTRVKGNLYKSELNIATINSNITIGASTALPVDGFVMYRVA